MSRRPTPARDLRRLSALVGLDVTAVRRAAWRDWGRAWALQLADGRVVILGHDRHVRDRRLLAERVTEAGANPDMHVSWGRARTVLQLLVRLDAHDYPEVPTP